MEEKINLDPLNSLEVLGLAHKIELQIKKLQGDYNGLMQVSQMKLQEEAKAKKEAVKVEGKKEVKKPETKKEVEDPSKKA